MSRPTRERNLMDMADVVSLRGTCERLQVGAVIARGSRVISTGYNGSPAGVDHCNHTPEEIMARRGCDNTIHAEQNAIAAAARHGVATDSCELYVTHMPCLQCAKVIIASGIVIVHYSHEYRVTDGVELLKSAGLTVSQLW